MCFTPPSPSGGILVFKRRLTLLALGGSFRRFAAHQRCMLALGAVSALRSLQFLIFCSHLLFLSSLRCSLFLLFICFSVQFAAFCVCVKPILLAAAGTLLVMALPASVACARFLVRARALIWSPSS